MKQNMLVLIGLMAVLGFTQTACTHYLDDSTTPVDPIDTTDNSANSNNPCSPDSVYFAADILPLLQSNCAMSGCHSTASHEDGVVLVSYSTIMQTGEITPFNSGNSEIYEVITETNPNKIMPPPPALPLSAAQIAMINTWIQQGALNNACNQNASGCDTTNMSFANNIRPILQSACIGCHQGNSPGGGINLSTYTGVLGSVGTGELMGSIRRQSGFSAMPKNGAALQACQINKIQAWINQGAPNN